MRNQKGFGLIGLILAVIGIMILGYILINRAVNSDTGQEVQDSASGIIDQAKDTVDKANQAGQRANDVIDDANNLIENVGQ